MKANTPIGPHNLWRPLTAENVRNPYHMYRALREQDPVHLSQTGEYILTRYDDIRYILKNPSFRSGNRLDWLRRGVAYLENKEEDLRAIRDAMNSFVLMLNGEQHRRIRTFISKAWHNREVDTIIQENIFNLLKSLSGKKTIDVVSEFAQPLPVYTISRILGIPVSDCRNLIELGMSMTKALDLYITLKDMVRIDNAAREFIAFFSDQIRQKYDKPDDGLLSQLILTNRSENAGLTDEELVSIAIFLFTAGEDTTASLITNALMNLLIRPVEMENVRRRPEKIPAVIEEVLRYDAVVHLVGRICSEQTPLGDKVIPAGATVTLALAAANRDPLVFPEPDEFIIDRTPNRHLAFGSGSHYCLGDWLGRRQSQLALNAILSHWPNLKLNDPAPDWYENLAIRRRKSLIVSRVLASQA